jgi:hypothetical protein
MTQRPDDTDDAMAISAALYVLGQTLDPSSVTKLVGVQPSAAWSKGEAIPRPKGEPGVRKSGGWTLRVHADSREPGAALQELLDQLDDRAVEIRNLAGVEDAYFDLFMARSGAALMHSWNCRRKH